MGYTLDAVQNDETISQQLQSPATAAWRRIATGQLDQLFFDRPLDLDLVGTRRLGTRIQGSIEALADESLPDPLHGPFADPQRLNDSRIGSTRPLVSFVGQKQDSGVRQLSRGSLAG